MDSEREATPHCLSKRLRDLHRALFIAEPTTEESQEEDACFWEIEDFDSDEETVCGEEAGSDGGGADGDEEEGSAQWDEVGHDTGDDAVYEVGKAHGAVRFAWAREDLPMSCRMPKWQPDVVQYGFMPSGLPTRAHIALQTAVA